MQIYLDYSATTPCRPEAMASMNRVMTQAWGNPSSLHEWGQRAATVLEQARMQVASLINSSPLGIVFTSGGTESNNLAIYGVARQFSSPQHLIISSVEHAAVSQPIAFLESQGWQVTRLPVDRWGRVNPRDLDQAIQANTVLVSVIYGQSEVGTLQPIAELAKICRNREALFHTDAVQVAGRLPVDVQALGVDLLSLSSHKLYGPQGVGALYIRPGVELHPFLAGGMQESGLRAGTQALPNIAGFGIAAELAEAELLAEMARLQTLRERLFAQLYACPQLQPTGHRLYRLPHHLSFTVADAYGTPLSGKTLVRQLNLAGIGVSSGSACNSGKSVPSPVLRAMGYDDGLAKSSLRLTLGKQTTAADIDWVGLVLPQMIERVTQAPVLMC
ncbi:cysteine desulfurase family protein [Thermosynechococcaceae cyanobacterium BACA0444]|uniref:cysteine desulfurase n=1 Tax=Pseudocalidococcus azoricus BACA0444 TaxID=2918990 RepID=A0AAE4FUK9_9CYAN|nr:cysteine desulfurase family protein [Pseudocalidococcus azoricus]MDS3862471.1 cysteine desulfurase family protein [Pseudocalidococcus azoricus BACA0444]